MSTHTIEALVNPFAQDTDEHFDIGSQKMEKPETEEDPLIRNVLKQYYKLGLDRMWSNEEIIAVANCAKALPSEKIDLVLQTIMASYPDEMVFSAYTGEFITALIQKSFNAGYNDFTLTIGDTAIPSLLKQLVGRKRRKIRYEFFGPNLNNDIFSDLIKCIGVYHGDVLGAWPLAFSTGSELTVYGDADGESLGRGSVDSTITVHGSVGKYCGDNAENCIFRTDRPDSYRRMTRYGCGDKQNLAQLITPDGKVLKEAKL